MKQKVYILHNQLTLGIAEKIASETGGRLVYSQDLELDQQCLYNMAQNCASDYFYVIKPQSEMYFSNFDFSYQPASWDSDYVHVWNHDTAVRLYNVKNVLDNAGMFTDCMLSQGQIKIKTLFENILSYAVQDIIFLSYDESVADQHFEKLLSRFPRCQRVHGVRGILNAHRAAAELATTAMVYIVDADADIMDDFNFDYQPTPHDINSVHVWHSQNPINDLEYGYGGVKLFPRDHLIKASGSAVDFTTSAVSIKVIPRVSNITRFNTDPFSAWRSGFRECVKLSSGTIKNQRDADTAHRLHTWCTVGADREFGDFAIQGAIEGRDFGNLNKDQPHILGLINDFSWLEKRFDN